MFIKYKRSYGITEVTNVSHPRAAERLVPAVIIAEIILRRTDFMSRQ